MAVAVQLDFLGATLRQYDEINERIGSLPGGPPWQHELFHWAAQTDDGFRVVDVWESKKLSRSSRGKRSAPPTERSAFPIHRRSSSLRSTTTRADAGEADPVPPLFVAGAQVISLAPRQVEPR